MNTIIINGSPRRYWNTHTALDKAAEGAAAAGSKVESVRLYEYEYKGCISCFACKLKNNKTNGICAYKDSLRPVLEKVSKADVVIIGSPVYFSQPTGYVRSFIERWLFPVCTYLWEDGIHKLIRRKVIPTGLIYTMNCPDDVMKELNYPVLLSDTGKVMEAIMGHNEVLYVKNTYQFRDYSIYDVNLYTEEEKRKYREEHFESDLTQAYELGKRLVLKAREM